jgi:hypothetical protein
VEAIPSVYLDYIDCTESSTTQALQYCKSVVDVNIQNNDFEYI